MAEDKYISRIKDAEGFDQPIAASAIVQGSPADEYIQSQVSSGTVKTVNQQGPNVYGNVQVAAEHIYTRSGITVEEALAGGSGSVEEEARQRKVADAELWAAVGDPASLPDDLRCERNNLVNALSKEYHIRAQSDKDFTNTMQQHIYNTNIELNKKVDKGQINYNDIIENTRPRIDNHILSPSTSWEELGLDPDGILRFQGQNGVYAKEFHVVLPKHPGVSAEVTIGKDWVGLGNVDNTSDASKPVSEYQKRYIDTADSTLELNLSNQINSVKTTLTKKINDDVSKEAIERKADVVELTNNMITKVKELKDRDGNLVFDSDFSADANDLTKAINKAYSLEKARAKKAEGDLNFVPDVTADNLTDAINQVYNKETALIESKIQSEENARIAADNLEKGLRENADTTLQNNIGIETTRATSAESALGSRIDNSDTEIAKINAKVPVDASSSNQLADKSFVNELVVKNTGTFRGADYTSVADIQAITDAKKNDYAYLKTEDPKVVGNYIYTKYICTTPSPSSTTTGTWTEAETLNNTPFTTAQWDAMNSTITVDKVNLYNNHLVDTNVHVTTTEKETWNNKLNKLFPDFTNGNIVEIQGNQLADSMKKAADVLTKNHSAVANHLLAYAGDGDHFDSGITYETITLNTEAINNEIAARQQGDKILETALNQEIQDRKDADSKMSGIYDSEFKSLWNNAAAQSQRITNAETRINTVRSQLEDKITAEVTRATSVEGDLNDLTTTAKNNLVAAINELTTGKQDPITCSNPLQIDALNNVSLNYNETLSLDANNKLQVPIDAASIVYDTSTSKIKAKIDNKSIVLGTDGLEVPLDTNTIKKHYNTGTGKWELYVPIDNDTIKYDIATDKVVAEAKVKDVKVWDNDGTASVLNPASKEALIDLRSYQPRRAISTLPTISQSIEGSLTELANGKQIKLIEGDGIDLNLATGEIATSIGETLHFDTNGRMQIAYDTDTLSFDSIKGLKVPIDGDTIKSDTINHKLYADGRVVQINLKDDTGTNSILNATTKTALVDISDYQRLSSNNLTTTNKTVVGAINELNTGSGAIDNRVSYIESLIEATTTPTNQLLPKKVIEDMISSGIATYWGIVTDPAYLPTTGIKNGDYAYVKTTDAAGNEHTYRYKVTNTGGTLHWEEEFEINTSQFTTTQWDAINSKMTETMTNNWINHYADAIATNPVKHITSAERTTWNAKADKTYVDGKFKIIQTPYDDSGVTTEGIDTLFVSHITQNANGEIQVHKKTAEGGKVRVTTSTANANRPILLTPTTWTSGNTTECIAAPTSNIYANPGTGALYANKVYGAVWNDYAEFRMGLADAGRCVVETGDGDLILSTERLQPAPNIVSDTYGFAIGETDTAKLPVAVSGRVLAYLFEDKATVKAGDAVCSGPYGTVSVMSREEIINYPDRIVGIVSELPKYETWGPNQISVNGRIWIKVR